MCRNNRHVPPKFRNGSGLLVVQLRAHDRKEAYRRGRAPHTLFAREGRAVDWGGAPMEPEHLARDDISALAWDVEETSWEGRKTSLNDRIQAFLVVELN